MHLWGPLGQPLNLRPTCTPPQRRCVFGDPGAKLFKFSCFSADFVWFKFMALLRTKNVSQTFFGIPQWHFSLFLNGRSIKIFLDDLEGVYKVGERPSFWIILAAFPLQSLGGPYTVVDIAPPSLESKSGSKEPKNRENLTL